MKSGLLKVSEAAKLLNVHPATLRRWEKEKRIVPIRDKNSAYRYYSLELIQEFLMRGEKAKIDVRWGYDPKKARIEELMKAQRSLDVIVSHDVTTPDPADHKEILKTGKSAIERGLKVRIIRNLDYPRMKEMAEDMRKVGYETRNGSVFGVTISIQDSKVVRIEIPSDSPDTRFDMIINDSKVARSFSLLFEGLWKG
ncbi:MAG: MerR family DNA-binding transcriptional regulator [Patescibacteria group bacterium]|nr:MerR family DNA-binding transcriptional regulator [Patescibacteria group bacterium]